MMDAFDFDVRRKKIFLGICRFIVLPLIAGFTLVDYIEGDYREFFADIVMGLVLAGGLVAQRKLDADLAVYRCCNFIISVGLLYSVVIGAGDGSVLFWLYSLPLMYMMFLGNREGSLWSAMLIVLLGIGLFVSPSIGTYTYSVGMGLRYLLSMLFVTIVAYGLESARLQFADQLTAEHKALRDEKRRLEEALAEVKTLSGLLPICSACKKIRDDQGYWNHVEAYIEKHSDAIFSHGMCPECGKKWYPGFDRKKKTG